MTSTQLPDVMAFGNDAPPITIEDMLERSKLLPVETGLQILQSTEPLAFKDFETGPSIRWRLEDNWNDDFESKSGTSKVNAFVKLQDIPGEPDSEEYQLTKDALLEATSVPGMGKGYVPRCPAFLVEEQLNYWYRTGLDKELRLMLVGPEQLVMGVTRGTVQPFSNLALAERSLEQFEAKNPGQRVFMDGSKLTHNLVHTYLQFVLPDVGRVIESSTPNDGWWGGVQISNSLIGKGLTKVEGFLFRQICTNGMIDAGPTAVAWTRRGGGQDVEEVYAWAERAVDEVLGGLETAFDAVQSLNSHVIDGNVADTLRDVFELNRVPQRARNRIISEMLETGEATMYDVANAVTMAANGDVPADEQQLLMRTGGNVVQHAERCGQCHRLVP